ncbi:MAG: ABC transporter ATP-binding protein [Anaerolineaceae bacterium]|nr:ABC transporter ATP-binding protein [Anaerolineaceae bacterium]
MSASEFSITRSWQTDRRGPVRWILSHVLQNKLFILGMFLGALSNAALAAAVPVLVGQGFDAVGASPPDLGRLGVVAGLIVGSQLVRGALQLGRNFSSEVLGQRLERDARDELYGSLIGKSMSFHDMHPTGELMARATNDVREVNLMFNPGVNLVVGSGMFLIMPLFVAPGIHPVLILAPALYLVAYALTVWHYLRRLGPAAERVRRRFGEMNASLAEAIEGIETVKAAAQEEKESRNFRGAVGRWRAAYVVQGDIEATFVPLLLLGLVQAGGLAHSLFLFRGGAIDVGDVVAFNGLLLLFGFPTFTAQLAYSRVATGVASARRILELINTESELDENVGGYEAPMRGEVRFENVSFCYSPAAQECHPGEAALQNISFQVRPGQTVAIVGQTGSGKSSLAKLLNRTYDADGGRVLVDGVDVRDWNMEALRQQISIIEQDIVLFSRSVAENISFGCPGATHDDIEAAARDAQAHEFITHFHDGYDTPVGERGVTLSGGQRQRIALARAFLTEPRILVLDDSTSAIDSATEDRIQRAIERAGEGRTMFLITHRLSQIRRADLIVVLRSGRVAAVGSHEELLRDSEAYRDIFDRYES